MNNDVIYLGNEEYSLYRKWFVIKGETMTLSIKTADDATDNGRATAEGTIGTAWMSAQDSVIDEAMDVAGIKSWPSDDVTHEQLMERLNEYANGWLETSQWEHEVGQFIEVDKTDENWIYSFVEFQDAWVLGYVEVLLDKITNKLGKNKVSS